MDWKKTLNICLNICLNDYMVKTITIKDTVYEELKAIKKPDESFSDLFERLTGAKRSMEILKSISGTVTFKDKKTLLKNMEEGRKGLR